MWRQNKELALKDGEGVKNFALRLTSIVSQFSILVDVKGPIMAIEKYLRIACNMCKHLVISMETLLNISTLSVEEVTRHLLALEDASDLILAQSEGRLYLTEE